MSVIPGRYCLKFMPVAVFLLFFQFSQAQQRPKKGELGQDRFASLDGVLSASSKLLGTDMVSMVWTDTLVFQKTTGMFNDRTAAPMGAASQLLTAALVLELVDEGVLNLDDKVATYLPVFGSYGKNYLTIRHCLTHFSGIANNSKVFNKKATTLDERVTAMAKGEIKANAGEACWYSEIGPNTAARVVEVVTKKKFEMLIKTKLLNRIGMRQTSFATLDGSAPNAASGAMISGGDYIKFLAMLLNNGKAMGQQILSPASMDILRSIAAPSDMIQDAPAQVRNYDQAFGAWSMNADASRKRSIVLVIPSLDNSWAVVDWCRHYAFMVLPKEVKSHDKAADFERMKDAVDEVMGDCHQ